MKYHKNLLNVLTLIALCCPYTRAEVILNPSFEFEHGGLMPNGYDISGWVTWGMPDNWAWRNFGNTNGHGVRVDALSSGWSSDGDWSLYIFASTAGGHQPGHYIEFYQFVDLTDVDAIVFDVRLRGGIYTNSYFAVDSQKVWVHNQAGWLPNVIVDVGNFSGIHEIALGVEVFEAFGDTADGWTHFDNIRAVLDPATLLGIEIIGPEEVTGNFSARFKAIAYNDSDITADITDWVIWSVEPQTYASIDENGLLHTGDINIPKDLTIHAKYTIGDVTFEADTIVRITLPYILYVPTNYATIQEAINAAEDSDMVIVADGIYTGPGNRDIDFKGKAIIVRSESGPENCIIDCNGTEDDRHRGFYFHTDERASSIVKGFTITNGYGGTGGAIFCKRSSPMIANCIIADNGAKRYGGGIACRYRCWPTISDCTISDNSAEEGGGLMGCEGSISNCTITGNSARLWGGGLSSCFGSISNCTITGNSARLWGGGLSDCFASISNCTITGNSARLWGGGLSDCFGSISNCTITGNSALDSGGGLSYCSGSISNCIIWNNVADRDAQLYRSAVPNYSCIQDWTSGGQGNISTDPCFVEAGYWDSNEVWVEGDYHLLRTSPCVDAGTDANNYSDIEGNARPFDFPGVDNNGELPEFDMGAYELVPVEAKMQLTPQTLNCSGKGKWVKAHITIAEGFYPEDVDVNEPAIAYPMEAESEYITVLGGDKSPVRLEVVFGQEAFCDSITDDYLDVTVIGSLITGEYFSATDTIRIISQRPPRRGK